MKFARYAYFTAGIFGLILGFPVAYAALFDVSETMPSPIGTGFFIYGFLVQFVAWQVLLFMLAADPLRFRPMMIPAFLAQVVEPLNSAWLHFYGHRIWIAASIAFLVLAVLFLISYWRTRPQAVPSAA